MASQPAEPFANQSGRQQAAIADGLEETNRAKTSVSAPVAPHDCLERQHSCAEHASGDQTCPNRVAPLTSFKGVNQRPEDDDPEKKSPPDTQAVEGAHRRRRRWRWHRVRWRRNEFAYQVPVRRWWLATLDAVARTFPGILTFAGRVLPSRRSVRPSPRAFWLTSLLASKQRIEQSAESRSADPWVIESCDDFGIASIERGKRRLRRTRPKTSTRWHGDRTMGRHQSNSSSARSQCPTVSPPARATLLSSWTIQCVILNPSQRGRCRRQLFPVNPVRRRRNDDRFTAEVGCHLLPSLLRSSVLTWVSPRRPAVGLYELGDHNDHHAGDPTKDLKNVRSHPLPLVAKARSRAAARSSTNPSLSLGGRCP